MFNFQKEIVINDPSKVVFIKKGSEGAKIGDKIRVNGGEVDYYVKYIDNGKIYKTAAVDAKNGEVKLQVSDIKLEAGEHMQIRLELGLDGDYRGDFGSALYYFRKPILVDIDSADKDKVAEALNKVSVSCERLFEAKGVAATTGEDPDKKDASYVNIVFADPAIKLRKGAIIVFAGGELDEVKKTIEVKMSQKNIPGVGTYEYVLHNLRMPTSANYRFNSPNAEEMPIKGQKYTQYSFSYTVPRPGLGGVSAAGQQINSTTVHTLFVAGTLDDKVFTGDTGAKTGLEVVTLEAEEVSEPSKDIVTVLKAEPAKKVVKA